MTTTLKRLDKVMKHKEDILESIYKRKGQSLVFSNVSFGLASRFEAASQLLEDELFDKVKTLGFWGCNISAQKLNELLAYLNSSKTLTSLEISDHPNILKKSTIKEIGELF